jgi:hypothetical protein
MTDEEPSVEAPAQVAKPVRNRPKWAVDAKERVQAAMRRHSKPLADRGAKDANEGDTEPKPEPASAVSADVQRIRAELVDVGIAARRTLERLRWARVLIAAAAQVVMAFIAWRIWVWRARRRRQ